MFLYKIFFHVNCFFKKMFLKIIYGKKIKFGKNVQFRRRFSVVIEDAGKLIIGDNVFFNNDCSINVMNNVNIGNNCLFGENVKIYDHNHKFRDRSRTISEQGYSIGKVNVGNNSWICSNVVLLKNADICEGCIVGAGCVIDEKLECNTITQRNHDLINNKIN